MSAFVWITGFSAWGCRVCIQQSSPPVHQPDFVRTPVSRSVYSVVMSSYLHQPVMCLAPKCDITKNKYKKKTWIPVIWRWNVVHTKATTDQEPWRSEFRVQTGILCNHVIFDICYRPFYYSTESIDHQYAALPHSISARMDSCLFLVDLYLLSRRQSSTAVTTLITIQGYMI